MGRLAGHIAASSLLDVADTLMQQLNEVLSADLDEEVGVLQQGIGHIALEVVQPQDVVLDGAGGNQAVDRHRTRLPDAVSTVGLSSMAGFPQG